MKYLEKMCILMLATSHTLEKVMQHYVSIKGVHTRVLTKTLCVLVLKLPYMHIACVTGMEQNNFFCNCPESKGRSSTNNDIYAEMQ